MHKMLLLKYIIVLLDDPDPSLSLSQTRSVWGQEPDFLTHKHSRLLAQKWIFSPAYLRSCNK